MRRFKRDEGNLIIEASFIVTLSVVFVAIMINIGFVVYEKMLMDAVATEAATGAAQVYASTYRDPIYGYIDDAEFYKTDLYRYTSNMFTDKLETSGVRKAKWLAIYSLKTGQLMKSNEPEVNAWIENKQGTILQHQVVVTITEKFDMPLAEVLGANFEISYTATGRADCIDLLDYFNTVSMINTEIGSLLDKFTAHINKFIGMFSLK